MNLFIFLGYKDIDNFLKQKIFLPTLPYISPIPTVYPQYTHTIPTPYPSQKKKKLQKSIFVEKYTTICINH